MMQDFSKSAKASFAFFQKLKRLLPAPIPLQNESNLTLRPSITSDMKMQLERKRPQEIRMMLKVENRLRIVEYLLKRYPEFRDNQVQDLIKEINDRNQDPRLYLGIVGEFNSGKSTFINALLRSPFLCMSSKPATTCTPTVIGYHPELKAQVYFADKKKKDFQDFRSLWITLFQALDKYSQEAQIKCLQEFVHKYSAVSYGAKNENAQTDDLAKQIHSVQVGYPSDVLKKHGLVIVDTPGANAKESHDILTGNITRQFCDTCIILIPKDTPCSQSLMKFIKTYLKDILHHCIFIVHKTDQIPWKERERFFKQIQTTLQRELKETGIKDFLLLPAASQILLDSLSQNDPNQQKWLEEFQETERKIYQKLVERKEIILSERIIACLNKLFRELTEKLNRLSQEYQKKYQELNSLKIVNLLEFTNAQNEEQTKELYAFYTKIMQEAGIDFQEMQKMIYSDCWQFIQPATSKTDLQERLKSYFNPYIQKSFFDRYEDFLLKYSRKVKNLTQERQEKFKEKFIEQYYKKLQALDQQIQNVDINNNFYIFINPNDAVNNIENLKGEEWVGMGIGGVIGGAIGLIFGGVGIPIGIALGTWIGNLIGPSLDTVKYNIYQDICNKTLAEPFEKLSKDAGKKINDFFQQGAKSLYKMVCYYFNVYNHQVDRMIQDLEKEKSDNRQYHQQIEIDIEQIQNEQNEIKRFQNRYCSIA